MGLVIHSNAAFEQKRPVGVARARGAISRLRSENDRLRDEIQRLRQFQEMAFRDALTGLRNRRSFEERLEEECARVRRGRDYRFAVVVVDVDDFKSINDTLGHATGDEVLRAVAQLMKSNVRTVDLCYRIGGDEFAVVLPDTDYRGAQIVIDRLRDGADPAYASLPVPVGLSLGAAGCPPEDPDTDSVVAAADRAMYADKARRKAQADQCPGAEVPSNPGH